LAAQRKLIWHIFLPVIGTILISLFVVSWQAARTVRQVYMDRQIEDLETRTFLVREIVGGYLSPLRPERLDSLCVALGSTLDCRFTVVLESGRVIGDSHESVENMDIHRDRPEIQTAFEGRRGISSRYSHTLNTEMLYVAVPTGDPAAPTAVIRTAVPLHGLNRSIRALHRRIAITGGLIALLSGLFALCLTGWINKPIARIARVVEEFGKGNLDHRLYIRNPGELNRLAVALNTMAGELDRRIRTITRQHNEIRAILASMSEAIVAVDRSERIIRFNQAAAGLFGMQPDKAEGRNIREVVRNTELIAFIRKTLEHPEPRETEITLSEGHCSLRVHGTALQDSDGGKIGALLVMHDITRIKHLERIRRDFVANVSHELKTPVTSIKGFVETLREGAIQDPDHAGRFLDILAKQADRLGVIIDDLLKLSRLEKDPSAHAEIVQSSISGILHEAVLVCRDAAEKKQLEIEKDFGEELDGMVDPRLIQEAVVNLIDNAVKYSEPGNRIRVSASEDAEGIHIRVRDRGIGIPEKHIGRIFERFYRVDMARSRELGGTGLGLSIVKHIAEVHHGSVSVESVLGEGSTFSLHLPKKIPDFSERNHPRETE